MTSSKSIQDAEGILDLCNDQETSINKSKNHFEKSNLEDYQATEEDPCLPTNNGMNSLDKNKYTISDHSLSKRSINFAESEKDEKNFFTENSDYPLSNSKKLKNNLNFSGSYSNGGDQNYDWSRSECENKIRQKLGLTHCGFLVGLFLLCATLLLLLIIIALGATWPHIPHSQEYPICVKSTCLRSSALILSKLDRTKSPCEDFYGFACGGLIKKHAKPPPSRPKWGSDEEMDLKLSEIIREVISVLPHQTRTNTLEWKIKNFYDSCMSLDNIETDNERPLRKIINELGGWNVLRNFQVLSWEFSKTLVKLHDEYGVTPFFAISTVVDPRNASKSILRLSPSGLGLPDKSYYYRGKSDRMTSSYCRYMKDIARQLGATSIDANSFSEDMFYFERRIAEVTPSTSELENVRSHEIHTINSLKVTAPSVPLHEILDAMFRKANINSDTEILLISPSYLSKISNIIATTDRSALNNYVIWNLVKEYLPYLSQNFQDIYSVYIREMTGATMLPERWEFCIKTLQKFMDAGMAAQIENSVFRSDIKKNEEIVGGIFDSVRQIVRESITKANWVDLELYKHFVSKLDNTTLQVGFPKAYLDSSYLEEYYSKFYVQKNNFFQNILYGVSYLQEDKRRSYVSPKNEYRWLSLVSSESKVLHLPSVNKVIVPQKLLNKPYYEAEYPLPVLYGTMGVQISRALVSSLLKYSGLYLANGSLIEDHSLIANLSSTLLDYQLNCLINLSVENDVVNEEKANKTSLDTFTTISAVKQAFKAMKRVTLGSEHIHQAGLEDFDEENLFYIAYAQSLFSIKTVPEIDKDNTTGVALNGSQMLKMVALQLKSFNDAFDCSPPNNFCKHIL